MPADQNDGNKPTGSNCAIETAGLIAALKQSNPDIELLKLSFERWDTIPTLWATAGAVAGATFGVVAALGGKQLQLPLFFGIAIVAAFFTVGIVWRINAINDQIGVIKPMITDKTIAAKITTIDPLLNCAVGLIFWIVFVAALLFVTKTGIPAIFGPLVS